MSNVSMIDGHIDGSKLTDNEVITIDEAIVHCYEVSDRKCDNCGKEHFQLAKWLEELKDSREKINRQNAEIDKLQEEIKNISVKTLKKFERKIKDVKVTLGQTWEIQNALKETLKEMAGETK